MTLPPERIGDKGQRYVVQTLDWPVENGEWQNAAYAGTEEGAEQMCAAFRRHPCVEQARWIDRG